LIVIDSSAIVAILHREATAEKLEERLRNEDSALLSVANYVETGQVLALRDDRAPEVTLSRFHAFLEGSGIVLAPIDELQARIALDARIKYGRGFGHPAKLNYSDCFAYALAKTRNLPLLFVGDDFTHTDIVPALR
jgi:ribonuclease VapC